MAAFQAGQFIDEQVGKPAPQPPTDEQARTLALRMPGTRRGCWNLHLLS